MDNYELVLTSFAAAFGIAAVTTFIIMIGSFVVFVFNLAGDLSFLFWELAMIHFLISFVAFFVFLFLVYSH